MVNNEDSAFKNIDYKNKTKAVPNDTKINDIDTDNSFYNAIIDAADNSTVDLNNINAFTGISQTRDDVYNLIDIMSEDPMISVALNIYAADACEPNDDGKIIWAESEDERVLGMVEYLLDQMNVDKNGTFCFQAPHFGGYCYMHLAAIDTEKLAKASKKDKKKEEK